MMYSCDDSNDFLHGFLTPTYPSGYYTLYRNMSIYCNILGAIYRYGIIQYHPSSTVQSISLRLNIACCVWWLHIAWLGSMAKTINFYSHGTSRDQRGGLTYIPFSWQSVKLFTTISCYATTTRSTQC